MTREFRLSGVRFWLWAWLLYGAFNLAVYGLIVYTGRVLDWNAVLACSAGLAVVLTVVAWKYRVTVSPEGIRFMDDQGAWKFYQWAQIEWAERTQVFGIPLLELRLAGSGEKD